MIAMLIVLAVMFGRIATCWAERGLAHDRKISLERQKSDNRVSVNEAEQNLDRTLPIYNDPRYKQFDASGVVNKMPTFCDSRRDRHKVFHEKRRNTLGPYDTMKKLRFSKTIGAERHECKDCRPRFGSRVKRTRQNKSRPLIKSRSTNANEQPIEYRDAEAQRNVNKAERNLDKTLPIYNNPEYKQFDASGSANKMSQFYNSQWGEQKAVQEKRCNNLAPYDAMKKLRFSKTIGKFVASLNKKTDGPAVARTIHLDDMQDGAVGENPGDENETQQYTNYGPGPHEMHQDTNYGTYDSPDDWYSDTNPMQQENINNERQLDCTSKRERVDDLMLEDHTTRILWACLFIPTVCVALCLYLFCFRFTYVIHEVIFFSVTLFIVVWLIVFEIVPYQEK